MHTVLAWKRNLPHENAASDVGNRLTEWLRTYFSAELALHTWEEPHISAVSVTCPIVGLKLDRVAQGPDGWQAAVDIPSNIADLVPLEQSNNWLRSYAEKLSRSPEATLRAACPPSGIIHYEAHSQTLVAQTDGLGRSQLFEYNDGCTYAISNRIAAFKSLGLPLEPSFDDWASRLSTFWFSGDKTGFRNVRYLLPSERIEVVRGRVSHYRFDVLRSWVDQPTRSVDECNELALSGVQQALRSLNKIALSPTAGLTGGWDSRAVIATLRASKVACSVRVKGNSDQYDVRIAKQLARSEGVTLRVKPEAELPPNSPTALKRCLLRSIEWQAGYMFLHKHKSFRGVPSFPDGGHVSVTGLDGYVGRSHFAKKLKLKKQDNKRSDSELEDLLVQYCLANFSPPFIRQDILGRVEEQLRNDFRVGKKYGLTGCRLLEFFYLHQGSRRAIPGGCYGESGIVYTPFVHPDFIRAAYSYPGLLKKNQLHAFIISAQIPEWIDIPFEKDMEEESRHDKGQSLGNSYFSNTEYWSGAGRPLISELLEDTANGCWNHWFSIDAAKELWLKSPDHIAVGGLIEEAFK